MQDSFDTLSEFYWPQPKKVEVPLAKPSLSEIEKLLMIQNFESTWIGASSPNIPKLENTFGTYFQSKSLLVSNGSVALMLALRSLGIQQGDEVLVPSLTYAATASSVVNVAAIPVFCDVELDSWQISPNSILKMITDKTRAIIVPHTYGVPADLTLINEIAHAHNLLVIEDSAESFGARYKSKLVGTIGDVGTFSFFPNKLITAGEGGLCLTNNNDIYMKMKLLRGQGMSEKFRYIFDEAGYNFRLTGMQAAILEGQFSRFEELFSSRQESEKKYTKLLPENCIIPNPKYSFSRSPWIFTCRIIGINVRNKKKLAKVLADKGVETRPVFYPLETMKAFSRYRSDGCLNSHLISNEGISFPTGSHVDDSTYSIIAKEVENLCA